MLYCLAKGGVNMEFKLTDKGNHHGAFEYELNGERVAEITWLLRDDVMHMDHTYVSDVLRGQGVAKKLLDAAAQYARENNYKMNAIKRLKKRGVYNGTVMGWTIHQGNRSVSIQF